MNNNDGVLVDSRNSLDEFISVVPSGQIVPITLVSNRMDLTRSTESLPITLVPIYSDILFTGVASDKHHCHVLVSSGSCSTSRIPVIEPPSDGGVILLGTLLDGFEGLLKYVSVRYLDRLYQSAYRDQVREFGSSGAPSHSEGSVQSTTVSISVRAALSRASIRAFQVKVVRTNKPKAIKNEIVPIKARVIGFFKGKAPSTFFSKTVEAAPISRTSLKLQSATGTNYPCGQTHL
jgi:hypothetical protein